jgi:hypothetical protein
MWYLLAQLTRFCQIAYGGSKTAVKASNFVFFFQQMRTIYRFALSKVTLIT